MTPSPTSEATTVSSPLGIIMNGVTGRMGYRQHLVRSILAIRDSGGLELADGLAQLVVALAHLQAEVVHPHPATARDGRSVGAHLDQQQLVVGPARREGRGREVQRHVTAHLPPPEDVAVEPARPLQVADVQDEMAELLDFHGENLLLRSPVER